MLTLPYPTHAQRRHQGLCVGLPPGRPPRRGLLQRQLLVLSAPGVPAWQQPLKLQIWRGAAYPLQDVKYYYCSVLFVIIAYVITLK